MNRAYLSRALSNKPNQTDNVRYLDSTDRNFRSRNQAERLKKQIILKQILQNNMAFQRQHQISLKKIALKIYFSQKISINLSLPAELPVKCLHQLVQSLVLFHKRNSPSLNDKYETIYFRNPLQQNYLPLNDRSEQDFDKFISNFQIKTQRADQAFLIKDDSPQNIENRINNVVQFIAFKIVKFIIQSASVKILFTNISKLIPSLCKQGQYQRSNIQLWIKYNRQIKTHQHQKLLFQVNNSHNLRQQVLSANRQRSSSNKYQQSFLLSQSANSRLSPQLRSQPKNLKNKQPKISSQLTSQEPNIYIKQYTENQSENQKSINDNDETQEIQKLLSDEKTINFNSGLPQLLNDNLNFKWIKKTPSIKDERKVDKYKQESQQRIRKLLKYYQEAEFIDWIVIRDIIFSQQDFQKQQQQYIKYNKKALKIHKFPIQWLSQRQSNLQRVKKSPYQLISIVTTINNKIQLRKLKNKNYLNTSTQPLSLFNNLTKILIDQKNYFSFTHTIQQMYDNLLITEINKNQAKQQQQIISLVLKQQCMKYVRIDQYLNFLSIEDQAYNMQIQTKDDKLANHLIKIYQKLSIMIRECIFSDNMVLRNKDKIQSHIFQYLKQKNQNQINLKRQNNRSNNKQKLKNLQLLSLFVIDFDYQDSQMINVRLDSLPLIDLICQIHSRQAYSFQQGESCADDSEIINKVKFNAQQFIRQKNQKNWLKDNINGKKQKQVNLKNIKPDNNLKKIKFLNYWLNQVDQYFIRIFQNINKEMKAQQIQKFKNRLQTIRSKLKYSSNCASSNISFFDGEFLNDQFVFRDQFQKYFAYKTKQFINNQITRGDFNNFTSQKDIINCLQSEDSRLNHQIFKKFKQFYDQKQALLISEYRNIYFKLQSSYKYHSLLLINFYQCPNILNFSTNDDISIYDKQTTLKKKKLSINQQTEKLNRQNNQHVSQFLQKDKKQEFITLNPKNRINHKKFIKIDQTKKIKQNKNCIIKTKNSQQNKSASKSKQNHKKNAKNKLRKII